MKGQDLAVAQAAEPQSCVTADDEPLTRIGTCQEARNGTGIGNEWHWALRFEGQPRARSIARMSPCDGFAAAPLEPELGYRDGEELVFCP
jgi:hypothetical protein